MHITYEQPTIPRHTADVSVDGVRVDGVLVDLERGVEQLVPVLGEPDVSVGIGSAYATWDHAGIGVALIGAGLASIDFVDSLTMTGAVLPAAAGETRVTVHGRDVLELDWDAAAPIDTWTTGIVVSGIRAQRCEVPDEYSFWSFVAVG